MSNYSDSKFTKDENSSWFKVYNLIKNNSKVLDVGCSSGNFGAVLINEKNCIVDGIEIDDDDLKDASKKLRKVYKLNIETDFLKVIGEKYDYVYFGDVIEHLVNPSNTLNRVKELLLPHGKIVFSIPNMAHISVRLMLLSGKFEYGETGLLDKTHLHFYTFNEFQRVVNNGGYNIENIDYVKKDMPEEIVGDFLASLGLKSTKEFISFLRSTDASAYQFVGTLSPTKSPVIQKKLDFSSPVDTFQEYLNNTIKSYASQVKELKKNNKDLIRVNRELTTEYHNSLEHIKNLEKRKLSARSKNLLRKMKSNIK